MQCEHQITQEVILLQQHKNSKVVAFAVQIQAGPACSLSPNCKKKFARSQQENSEDKVSYIVVGLPINVFEFFLVYRLRKTEILNSQSQKILVDMR
jgi:hypothetical protein